MSRFSAGLMHSSGGISHLVNSHTMPHTFLQIFTNESCMNLPSLTIPAIRPSLWTVLLIQKAGSQIPATVDFVSNRVKLLQSDPRIPPEECLPLSCHSFRAYHILFSLNKANDLSFQGLLFISSGIRLDWSHLHRYNYSKLLLSQREVTTAHCGFGGYLTVLDDIAVLRKC